MGVIPMGEHYKSIFLSVIILADKFQFVGMGIYLMVQNCFGSNFSGIDIMAILLGIFAVVQAEFPSWRVATVL